MTNKVCHKCRQTKPLQTGFYKHPRGIDGYACICIECKKEQTRLNKLPKYWQNEQNLWCRKCPKCDKVIVYNNENTTEAIVKYMTGKKSLCLDCHNQSKIGKPLPLAKPKVPLNVGERNMVKVKTDRNGNYTYMTFVVIQYQCPNCKTSIIRKVIDDGEPFMCLCKCGKWNAVSVSFNSSSIYPMEASHSITIS